jgi:hypothetical protein
LIQFEDDFEGDTGVAVPMFATEYMEYGVIDGEGVLTSHFPGGIMLAYYKEPELLDFILEVDVRPLNFAAGSKAGVTFRSEYPVGGADYYQMISIFPNEAKIELITWLDGEFAQIEAQNIPPDLIPPYGVYKLKIDCQGKNIRVYLGEDLAAEFTSTLILEPGYFTLSLLSTRDPETVLFDNLVITEHP